MFAPHVPSRCPQCDLELIGPAHAMPCEACGLDFVWVQAAFRRLTGTELRPRLVPIGPMRRFAPRARRDVMFAIDQARTRRRRC